MTLILETFPQETILKHPRPSAPRIAWVALLLFLINWLGYVGFRSAIANDMFGGDVINMAGARMTSYRLNE